MKDSLLQEPWMDRIGDRLDHPERVPHELRHLIPDDKARVEWICDADRLIVGEGLEVGCSDGSVGRRICAAHPGLTLVQTDRDQWDIRTQPPDEYHERFDVVYCCEVLEHLSAYHATLAATHLQRCCKPMTGVLIVTVPNEHPAPSYVAGCRDRWRWPGHQSTWTRGTLQRLLRDAGFDPVVFDPLYPADRASRSIWLLAKAFRRASPTTT